MILEKLLLLLKFEKFNLKDTLRFRLIIFEEDKEYFVNIYNSMITVNIYKQRNFEIVSKEIYDNKEDVIKFLKEEFKYKLRKIKIEILLLH